MQNPPNFRHTLTGGQSQQHTRYKFSSQTSSRNRTISQKQYKLPERTLMRSNSRQNAIAFSKGSNTQFPPTFNGNAQNNLSSYAQSQATSVQLGESDFKLSNSVSRPNESMNVQFNSQTGRPIVGVTGTNFQNPPQFNNSSNNNNNNNNDFTQSYASPLNMDIHKLRRIQSFERHSSPILTKIASEGFDQKPLIQSLENSPEFYKNKDKQKTQQIQLRLAEYSSSTEEIRKQLSNVFQTLRDIFYNDIQEVSEQKRSELNSTFEHFNEQLSRMGRNQQELQNFLRDSPMDTFHMISSQNHQSNGNIESLQNQIQSINAKLQEQKQSHRKQIQRLVERYEETVRSLEDSLQQRDRLVKIQNQQLESLLKQKNAETQRLKERITQIQQNKINEIGTIEYSMQTSPKRRPKSEKQNQEGYNTMAILKLIEEMRNRHPQLPKQEMDNLERMISSNALVSSLDKRVEQIEASMKNKIEELQAQKRNYQEHIQNMGGLQSQSKDYRQQLRRIDELTSQNENYQQEIKRMNEAYNERIEKLSEQLQQERSKQKPQRQEQHKQQHEQPRQPNISRLQERVRQLEEQYTNRQTESESRLREFQSQFERESNEKDELIERLIKEVELKQRRCQTIQQEMEEKSQMTLQQNRELKEELQRFRNEAGPNIVSNVLRHKSLPYTITPIKVDGGSHQKHVQTRDQMKSPDVYYYQKPGKHFSEGHQEDYSYHVGRVDSSGQSKEDPSSHAQRMQSELSRNISEKNKEIDQKNKEIDQKNKEIDQKNHTIQQLRTQMKSLLTNRQGQEQHSRRLNQRDNQIIEKQKDIQELHYIIEELKRQIDSLATRNREIETLYYEAKNQHSKNDDHKRQIHQFKQKIEEYERNMKEMTEIFSSKERKPFLASNASSTKVFEQKIIYDLKSENELLRRKLIGKYMGGAPSQSQVPTPKNRQPQISQMLFKYNLRDRLVDCQLSLEQSIKWCKLNGIPQKEQQDLQNVKELMIDLQKISMEQESQNFHSQNQFLKGSNINSHSNMMNSRFQRSRSQALLNKNLVMNPSPRSMAGGGGLWKDQSEQLTFYKEKNKQLEQRVDSLLKMNNELKVKLDTVLEHNKSHSKGTVSFFKEQLQQSQTVSKSYETRMKHLNEENSALRRELSNKKTQVRSSNHSNLLRDDHGGIYQIQVKLQQTNRKLISLEQQINKLQGEKQNILGDIKFVIDKYQRSKKNQQLLQIVDRLNQIVHRHEEYLPEKSIYKRSFIADFQTFQHKIESSNRVGDSAIDRNNKFAEELTRINQLVDQLKKENQKLITKNQILERELSQKTDQQQKPIQCRSDAEQQIAKLSKLVGLQRDQIAALKVQDPSPSLLQRIRKLELIVEEQNHEIATKNSEIINLKNSKEKQMELNKKIGQNNQSQSNQNNNLNSLDNKPKSVSKTSSTNYGGHIETISRFFEKEENLLRDSLDNKGNFMRLWKNLDQLKQNHSVGFEGYNQLCQILQ